MKKVILPIVSCLLILGITESCKSKFDEKKYLTQILNNLEQVKSASYISISSNSFPFDTIPNPDLTMKFYFKEFDNPADTLLGFSRGIFYIQDTTKMYGSANEYANIYIDYDTETIRIDSLRRSRPFSFFNGAKTIIKYALTTNDSILKEFHDFGDSLLFRLTIYSDKQVALYFIKPLYYNEPTLPSGEISEYVISKYDLWINKTTGLPYKRRVMFSHTTNWQELSDIQINKMDIKDFIPARYFPADYNIEIMGQGTITPPTDDLIGKTASDWTLSNYNNEQFALKNFTSKALLLQFSGIGCPPCHASLPFLNRLVDDYKDKSFELVRIECWNNNNDMIKSYISTNDIKYKFLKKDADIEKNYNILAVPTLFILDNNRVIQKVIRGYSTESEKEIRVAIEKLL